MAARKAESLQGDERLVEARARALVDLLDAEASLSSARAGAVMKKNAYTGALLSLSFESGTILKDLGLE